MKNIFLAIHNKVFCSNSTFHLSSTVSVIKYYFVCKQEAVKQEKEDVSALSKCLRRMNKNIKNE